MSSSRSSSIRCAPAPRTQYAVTIGKLVSHTRVDLLPCCHDTTVTTLPARPGLLPRHDRPTAVLLSTSNEGSMAVKPRAGLAARHRRRIDRVAQQLLAVALALAPRQPHTSTIRGRLACWARHREIQDQSLAACANATALAGRFGRVVPAPEGSEPVEGILDKRSVG